MNKQQKQQQQQMHMEAGVSIKTITTTGVSERGEQRDF